MKKGNLNVGDTVQYVSNRTKSLIGIIGIIDDFDDEGDPQILFKRWHNGDQTYTCFADSVKKVSPEPKVGDTVVLKSYEGGGSGKKNLSYPYRKHATYNEVKITAIRDGAIEFDEIEFEDKPNIKYWPANAVEVIYRELNPGYVARHDFIRGQDEQTDRTGYCPACLSRNIDVGTAPALPFNLATLIKAGKVDCPICGWRTGRCNSGVENGRAPCNGYLIPSYGGGQHCMKCGREYK